MKILDKYAPHEEIYKSGFLFDPDSCTFFTENTETFKKPANYEDWNVEQFDFKQYGKQRLKELGITTKLNEVEVIGSAQEPESKERIKETIFSINKNGCIEILQYGLDRKPFYRDKNKTESVGRGVVTGKRYCWQQRNHPIIEKLTGAKYDFTHAINTPFWSPILLQYFEDKTEVETLFLTEGQFKAHKGCIAGIPTVGLTSISHFRDSETKTLHPEIISFMQTCKVKKLVILWDGDCTNISSKDLLEGNEITKRPNNFYKFAQSIRNDAKKYVKTKNFRVLFATILSDKIENNPKGLDDLLICGIEQSKILREFEHVGEIPTINLHWEDITTDDGIKNMRRFFALDHVNKFYQKHEAAINGRTFIYFGSTYKVDKGVPVIEVNKDLKTIKRIGDEYYQLIEVPVPNGKKGEVILEERLSPRKKGEIIEDHGKDSVKYIEKFKGFTNVANHIDYQSVIAGHWNLYYNVNHTAEQGDFPTIKSFLNHLFEEHEENEMIYDYLTILYRNPMQKLPVICLVSKLQSTGKSTFIYFLKLLFKQNLSIISNNDLIGEFNSHWTSSLIVASEETMLEKKDSYEKIKSLSTAFEITRNEKNKTSSPIPCMVHFVFCSNHEDDFIKIDDYDSRLWIRKIKKLENKIDDFDTKLEAEIKHFVHFLETREIKYQYKGRLYFHEDDFLTNAKKNIIQNSEPSVIKELRTCLDEYFTRFDKEECLMTISNIKQYFAIKGEKNYLNKAIKTFMNVEKWKNDKGEEGTTTFGFCIPDFQDPNKYVTVKDKGRPFVFKRQNIEKK